MALTDQQLQEMYDWYQSRQTQQLSYPVDDASKAALGALTFAGGSTKAPTFTIGAGGGTVAALPTGFIVVNVEGATHIIATYD
jgi:hypothetical protein